jgi:hypothetical protein
MASASTLFSSRPPQGGLLFCDDLRVSPTGSARSAARVPGNHRVEAAYAVGRAGDPALLAFALRAREFPSDRDRLTRSLTKARSRRLEIRNDACFAHRADSALRMQRGRRSIVEPTDPRKELEPAIRRGVGNRGAACARAMC